MKLFINILIEVNKDNINSYTIKKIKGYLGSKYPEEILQKSRKFIAKETWIPIVKDGQIPPATYDRFILMWIVHLQNDPYCFPPLHSPLFWKK